MDLWLLELGEGWRVGVVQGWPSAGAQGVGGQAEADRRGGLGPAPCTKHDQLPQGTRA